MTRLSPKIRGAFHVDISKYPDITLVSLRDRLTQFVQQQHPSSSSAKGNVIYFSNRLFRLKVNRARNFTRAFNQGKIEVRSEDSQLEILFEGSLYRGVSIATIQTLIFSFGIFFFAPNALFVAPLLFVLGYFLQVYMTHVVFPMAVSREVHEMIKEKEG